jgi:hypothetical protein
MHIRAGYRRKLLNRRQHRLHYLSGSSPELPTAPAASTLAGPASAVAAEPEFVDIRTLPSGCGG